MKLNNFKELLLRKSTDNQDLQLLIKYIKDDYLVDHIVESLEKMAASDANRKTNASVKHFGSNYDEHVEGDMIRDQLGHHASRYKAAIKAGDNKTADEHMKKIFNTMYMTQKVTRDGKENHTGGQLSVSAVDPKPWEETGKHGKTSDTYGWKIQPNNFDDFRKAPSPGRDDAIKKDGSVKKYKKDRYLGEIKGHGHNKSYPLEEIKINGKHIHIDDGEHTGKFESHPFDSHPIIEQSRTPNNSKDGEEKHADYISAHDKFHGDGGGADQYWDMVDSRDPKEHEARGSKKSDPVHAHLHGENFKALDLDSPATPAAVSEVATPIKEPTDGGASAWANSPLNPKNKGGQ